MGTFRCEDADSKIGPMAIKTILLSVETITAYCKSKRLDTKQNGFDGRQNVFADCTVKSTMLDCKHRRRTESNIVLIAVSMLLYSARSARYEGANALAFAPLR